MKKLVMILCAVVSTTSCKPRGNGYQAQASPNGPAIPSANVDDIKSCSVSLDSGDKLGFNFQAPSLTFGNAYWAALASAYAYKNSVVAKPTVTNWVTHGPVKFQYYGNDPTGKRETTGTQAFWADFPGENGGSILAFRGTAGIQDLLRDANVLKVGSRAFDEDDPEFAMADLKIHKGFWNGLEELADWDGSGSRMKLWDKILANHILNIPYKTYSLEDPSQRALAFRAVDQALQGAIQTIDVQESEPDEKFWPMVATLKQFGFFNATINGPSAPTSFKKDLLTALNVWSDTTSTIGKALIRARGDTSNPGYQTTLGRETRRQEGQFQIIHKYWAYRDFRPLWLTGHSLGAALATVAAYRFMSIGVPVQGLITFGSPRVGTQIFTGYMLRRFIRAGSRLNVIRFQNNNDGVTRIPSMPWWRDLSAVHFINNENQLLIPRLTDGEAAMVTAGLRDYPSNGNWTFYQGPTPPNYRGIWTFAVESFIGDHSMTDMYLAHMKKYAFGSEDCGAN